MMSKVFSVIIALCIVMSLAACGKAENSDSQPVASENKVTENGSVGSDEDTGMDDEEDMAEINMVFMSMAAIPNGLQAVEDAINEITEAEINTHVNIEMIEVGSYDQQVGLKISSSEKVDLMVSLPTGSAAFASMISQNQLMDISDLLSEYGQGVLDTVGTIINATSVDDAVYGVPSYRSYVTSIYIAMRTDVLEDLGLLEKAQSMTTFTEYEEILDTVKNSEKWNYLSGVVAVSNGEILSKPGAYIGNEDFSDANVYDQLGELNKLVSVSCDGSSTEVLNNFDTDEYKAMYTRVKGWNDKGYIYKDSTTTKETGASLIKSNAAFSIIVSGESDVQTSQSSSCGYDMTCTKVVTRPISTADCQKFVWVVPNSATEPEAAVKMMNLLFTDASINNLLAWGIEGTDYVVEDGIARYLDEKDADSTAYHTVDFIYGNQFLIIPWDGNEADLREKAKLEMNEAPVSAFLGFSCDTSDISSELSAVINTLNEYKPSIDSGLASEDDYAAFLKKMDASGLPKIIDTYQTQLDAWYSINKN